MAAEAVPSGSLGWYEVVHSVVALRSAPKITAAPWGRLLKNGHVLGRPHQVGGETWIRLSEQQIAPPCAATVQSTDSVWALVDATPCKELKLGVLLRRVRDATSDATSYPAGSSSSSSSRARPTTVQTGSKAESAPAGEETFRVVSARVVARQRPSLEGSILGYLKSGVVIRGTPVPAEGQNWLRFSHSGGQAYCLLDGNPLGLNTLLQRETATAAPLPVVRLIPMPATSSSTPSDSGKTFTATPKAVGKAAPKAGAAASLGDLSKWIGHAPGEWASFTVVPEQAMVRSAPSTKSRPAGIIRKGDILEGEVRSEWLLLDKNLTPADLQAGKGRWVLIDGTPLNVAGLGLILDRYIHEPEVKLSFSEALDVLRPEFSSASSRAKHVLEVVTDDGDVQTLEMPEKSKVIAVKGLPFHSKVKLRFRLKGDDRGTWAGASNWLETMTRDTPHPFEEYADDYAEDLIGQQRSGCRDCACKAFALMGDGVTLNMNMADARCGRCGCGVTCHALVAKEKPKPAPVAPTASAKRTPKPVERAAPEVFLIDRAVALPKKLLLEKFELFDCPKSWKEWPRLPGSFKEAVTWSDLHSDMGANLEHLRNLPECPETVLLLAGDVATKMSVLESSLRLLQKKFGAVFYTPGNHELWVVKREGLTSMHKFLVILELCEKLGVHTRPAFINDRVAVCPMFTWYKDNLCDGFSRERANMPFDVQTSWPWEVTGRGDSNDAQLPGIADFFMSLNERRLQIAPKKAVEAMRAFVASSSPEDSDAFFSEDCPVVLTMSHFVPRQECYPGPRRLCGVMGCREIEEQARLAGSRCHVFGHSHIACDFEVEGIRYVQHPLGYPHDWHRKDRPKRVWGFGSVESHEILEEVEPPATLSEKLWKAWEQEIRDCKELEVARPPGAWQNEGSNKAIFTVDDGSRNRKEDVDLNNISEQWSGPPPTKELEISLKSMVDNSFSVTVTISNDSTVKQLKEQLVQQVGRGAASKVMLSTNGENALQDNVLLSAIEDEVLGGISVMGLDMRPPKEVSVKIVHKTSEIPQGLSVKVPDTSTILELRKAIMQQLGEPSLSRCKLVKTSASGTFTSIPDHERLNGRSEFGFLGRDLPVKEAVILVNCTVHGRSTGQLTFRLDAGSGIQQLKAKMIAWGLAKNGAECKPEELTVTQNGKVLDDEVIFWFDQEVGCDYAKTPAAASATSSIATPARGDTAMAAGTRTSSAEAVQETERARDRDRQNQQEQQQQQQQQKQQQRQQATLPGAPEQSRAAASAPAAKDLPSNSNGEDSSQVLSEAKIVHVLQDLKRKCEAPDFRGQMQQLLPSANKTNGDSALLRRHLGTIFAIAAKGVLEAHKLSSNKQGFDRMFQAVYEGRSNERIQALVWDVESMMGLAKGEWFGILEGSDGFPTQLEEESTSKSSDATTTGLPRAASTASTTTTVGSALREPAANDSFSKDGARASSPSSSSSDSTTTTPPAATRSSSATTAVTDVPSKDSAKAPSMVEVLITHATSEEQLQVEVLSIATVLDVRKAIMEVLGETKLSAVKLVKVQKAGGFASLSDTEKLKQRRELLALGREFGTKPLEVTMILSRDPDITSKYTLLPGSTIRTLKRKLCQQDPTGIAELDSFELKALGTSTALPESQRLSDALLNFELLTN